MCDTTSLKVALYFAVVFWIVHYRKCSNLARSSPPEMFLGKGVLKKWSKLTGELPCRNVISIKLLCNFIESPIRHGCSPVNLLHILRTPFYKNISRWLLLKVETDIENQQFRMLAMSSHIFVTDTQKMLGYIFVVSLMNTPSYIINT